MALKEDYLIQVLEKIGAPLLSSIVEVSAGGEEDLQEAQKMAELLTKTTQTALEMTAAMNAQGPDQGDSFRLALAALAAPIIADYYRYDKQVPGDADIKKIITALQTVLTFSDNFETNVDNTNALRDLGNGTKNFDPGQVALRQIMAFTPVINAISGFSFGENEQKLIRDVAERLIQRAMHIGASFTNTEAEKKMATLAILKCLARLYAACHQAETTKLQSGGEAGLETVWKNFETRAAMLEVLSSAFLGNSSAVSSSSESKAPAAPISTASSPPSTPAAPSTTQQSGGGFNPMGAFTKKPADESPSSQPAEKPANPPSNPMGFFKPGAKKSDE